MRLINKWRVRRLERRIVKWKEEGQRLAIILVKCNTEAFVLQEYCKKALDDFLMKPKKKSMVGVKKK